MMRPPILLCAALVLLAIPATAQRPVFEPDDFVDPAMRNRPLFLLRLAAGGLSNFSDHYRPSGGNGKGNAGFVLITNSWYSGPFQLDYKHGEFAGKDAPPVQRCDCPDPVYFPTPPPANATPAAAVPERNDTLQVSFYRISGRSSRTPSTLRYRLSFTRQPVDTAVTSISTGEVVERRSGSDQTLTFDADTHFRMAGRDVWGTLYFARTVVSDTTDDRTQNVFAYVSRLPGWAAGPLLFRPKLTIGGITNRGATGLNLINPYLEAFWRNEKTKADVHLAWSAERTRSGADGWRTNHQVALFLDLTLYVKVFGLPRTE
jgi:hypothetical protein